MTRLVIGLTGGIGSGKSAAAEEFARLGAAVVDTDVIAHELTRAGGAAMGAVLQRFGNEFVLPDGSMDRKKMRERVFADPESKQALEALLHPMIRAESQRRIDGATAPYVIHVVPLLVESSAYRLPVHRVLVVDCSEDVQLARVRARSGLAEAEVRAILRAQATRSERLAAADDVIDNDGTLDALRHQVARLHAQYQTMASELED